MVSPRPRPRVFRLEFCEFPDYIILLLLNSSQWQSYLTAGKITLESGLPNSWQFPLDRL